LLNTKIKTVLICFPFVICTNLIGQISLTSVDFGKVKQQKIQQLITQQISADHTNFSDLEVSVECDDDAGEFSRFSKCFKVNQPPELVWERYMFTDQTEIWDSKRVSFGVLYSRRRETVAYADEHFFGMEEGQIYFLSLNLLGGLYKLPVAFEIIRADDQSRTIEFSYLKGGKAEGKQIIQFIETSEGNTTIIHSSFVKSNSKLRDKFLYPFFHNKIIREFHSNMKRIISRQAKYSKRQLAKVK
jgi:hypothetical protein